jgi:hypothetical protein
MKIPFIPQDDQGKADFLDNLALKIGGYAATLGLTPAEVASVTQDAAMFNYMMDMQAQAIPTARMHHNCVPLS